MDCHDSSHGDDGQEFGIRERRAGSCAGRVMESEFRLRTPGGRRDGNAKNSPSPLIRLPAELRNKIYGLVLGHSNIHVYAHTKPNCSKAAVEYYTCTAGPNTKSKGDHPEWLQQHLPCFQGSSQHLPNLAMLSTCKQIRAEASLISYSTNTFMFVAPSSLNAFVSGVVSSPQARAMKSIAVWTALEGPREPDVSWDCWQPAREIEDGALSGIMDLKVFVSVFGGLIAQGVDWRVGDRLRGLIGVFGGLGLRKVDVAIGLHESGVLSDEEVSEYTEYAITRLSGQTIRVAEG